MTRRLIVRRRAELHLSKAVSWYEQQRPGLGTELVSEVGQTLQTIAERPESFPISYRNARRANTARFPYAVFYLLQPDTIVVTAVLHTSQDRGSQRADRL